MNQTERVARALHQAINDQIVYYNDEPVDMVPWSQLDEIERCMMIDAVSSLQRNGII